MTGPAEAAQRWVAIADDDASFVELAGTNVETCELCEKLHRTEAGAVRCIARRHRDCARYYAKLAREFTEQAKKLAATGGKGAGG